MLILNYNLTWPVGSHRMLSLIQAVASLWLIVFWQSCIQVYSFPNKFIIITCDKWYTVGPFLPLYKLCSLNWIPFWLLHCYCNSMWFFLFFFLVLVSSQGWDIIWLCIILQCPCSATSSSNAWKVSSQLLEASMTSFTLRVWKARYL